MRGYCPYCDDLSEDDYSREYGSGKCEDCGTPLEELNETDKLDEDEEDE